MTADYEPTQNDIEQIGHLLNKLNHLLSQYEAGPTILPLEYYSLLRSRTQLSHYLKQVAVRLYADVAALNPDFVNYVSDH